MDETLHPCPLCGGKRGYTLRDDGDHKRWNAVCLVCGEVVAECRRHRGNQAAQQAWNEAGAYAAGLLADRDRLAAENAELRKRVPPDGWVAVGWLTECVWEDGTSYSFSYNEPKPIPTSTGMISQRIGRAYFDTTRPIPSAQARSTLESTDGR